MLTAFFLLHPLYPDFVQPRYKTHKPLMELLLTFSPCVTSEAWTEIRLTPDAEIRLAPEAVSFLGRRITPPSVWLHADPHPLSLK